MNVVSGEFVQSFQMVFIYFIYTSLLIAGIPVVVMHSASVMNVFTCIHLTLSFSLY